MIHDEFSGASLHNVAGTEDAPWTDGGRRLLRVPASVAAELNDVARERLRHPTGCELRFVPESNEAVAVTLSSPAPERVRTFWGEFQMPAVFELHSEPTTHEFAVPEALYGLEDRIANGRFDPRVCRLRFEPDAPVAVHDVAGACRPPQQDEIPDHRYLAYGTSITEGEAATATHLGYVSRVARRVGADPFNLGCSGSAFCERAIAEHIAGREDWDIASLSVSVNMANREFTIEQFRDRAETLVETVTRAHPDRPVVCITLFPYHADLSHDGDADRAMAFRSALVDAATASAHGDLRVVDGLDAMAPTGLSTDLLHPGDHGMASIAADIASAFEDSG